MFATRLTREQTQSTWTACPSCQSCPPRLLHRRFQGNSSSLSSLHLSLRHRPSSPANSALPRASLQDLCGRCLSDLHLSALSRRGTPSPPYSPTSGCLSSKDHHLNQDSLASTIMMLQQILRI